MPRSKGITVRRHRLYYRQLLLFLALSAILVGALSAAVIGSFRNFSQREIETTLERSLERINHQLTYTYERAVYVALALYRDADASGVLFGSRLDSIDHIRAIRAIRDHLSAHPFLLSATLYNREHDAWVGNGLAGDVPKEDPAVRSAIQGASSSAPSVVVRRIAASTGGFLDHLVLTIVHTEASSEHGIDHAVLVDLPFASILDHVASASSATPSGTYLIAPDLTTVFPEPDGDFDPRVPVAPPLEEGREMGTMQIGGDSGPVVVAYRRNRSSGVTAVIAYTLDQLYGTTRRLQGRLSLIGVAILAAGWGLSVVLSRYAYEPIRRLLDRVDPEHFHARVERRLDEMEYVSKHITEAHQLISTLRNQSMRQTTVLTELTLRARLLGGPLPPGSTIESDVTYRCALCFPIDEAAGEYTTAHVRDVVQTRFPGTTVVVVDRDAIVVLLPDNAAEAGFAQGLIEAFQQEVGVRFSAATAEEAVPLSKLRERYEALRRLARNRLFDTEPKVYTPLTVAAAHGKVPEYDTTVEHALLDDLRLGREEEYRDRVASLCRRMRDCTYDGAMSVLLQLVLVVIRATDDLAGSVCPTVDATARRPLLELTAEIENVRSFDAVVDRFADRYRDFHTIAQAANSGGAVRDEQRVQAAERFVQDHLSDPNLSVPLIAEACGVSPRHLSRIFKSYAGESVNEHIIRRRVAYAKRLLSTTDMTVEAVAADCGVLNAKYFFQLFKKHVGLTPASFRTTRTTRTLTQKSADGVVDTSLT